MSKHLMTGFVYCVKYSWSDEAMARWHHTDKMAEADPSWVLVKPHDFEIEIPDDFDPRPQQVAALQAEKIKVRAELGKRLMDLDAQISKLLAITMEEPA